MKQIIVDILKIIPKSIRKKVFGAFRRTLSYDDTLLPKNMFEHIKRLKVLGYEPDTIIDIGAYIGDWTKEVLMTFPNADFILFEAQQSKMRYLESLTGQHNNVSFQIVLLGSEHKDQVVFFEMETGSSVFEENTNFKREQIHLPMWTLDECLKSVESLGSCFIKLDVQGSEIEILKGAPETLKCVDVILLEASTLPYNQDGPIIAEIFAFMNQIGFVLWDICDEKRIKKNVLLQVDFIFVSKEASFRNNINLSIS